MSLGDKTSESIHWICNLEIGCYSGDNFFSGTLVMEDRWGLTRKQEVGSGNHSVRGFSCKVLLQSRTQNWGYSQKGIWDAKKVCWLGGLGSRPQGEDRSTRDLLG